MHIFGLTIFFMVIWLLLSGHYTLMLVGLGIASVLLVIAISIRMEIVDKEGQGTHVNFIRLAKYLVWLLKEIIKANIDVCLRIVRPSMPISPTLLTIQSLQKTDFGRVVYANSITLTPGTISINIDADKIAVHALTLEAADQLKQGEMNSRAATIESGR